MHIFCRSLRVWLPLRHPQPHLPPLELPPNVASRSCCQWPVPAPTSTRLTPPDHRGACGPTRGICLARALHRRLLRESWEPRISLSGLLLEPAQAPSGSTRATVRHDTPAGSRWRPLHNGTSVPLKPGPRWATARRATAGGWNAGSFPWLTRREARSPGLSGESGLESRSSVRHASCLHPRGDEREVYPHRPE